MLNYKTIQTQTQFKHFMIFQALGGANSNTKRVQEHNLKIDQQLHHEETKKHLLEQQQLQIDAMNTQNQIQAETRADHQEAFITSKLEIENQLAAEREMLYAQIEAQRRERAERALKLQQLIDGVFEDEDEYDSGEYIMKNLLDYFNLFKVFHVLFYVK